MTIEEKKELVRQFYDELYNQHNLAAVDDCLGADYVSHENAGPDEKEVDRNPEDIKKMVQMFYSAFPDQKTRFDAITVEDDLIVTPWTTQGTHYGDFMGIAPTRKQVTISGTCLDRVVDGKIVESWVKWDLADLLRQLGVSEFKKAA